MKINCDSSNKSSELFWQVGCWLSQLLELEVQLEASVALGDGDEEDWEDDIEGAMK